MTDEPDIKQQITIHTENVYGRKCERRKWTSTKPLPEYIENTSPRSGWDCIDDSAYRNAMIGRKPTPYADYAAMLRYRYAFGELDYSFNILAGLIEKFYGEERRHKFFDFFPAANKLYRIDDRTTAPLNGWSLDQDRRMLDELKSYDELGYHK